MEDHPTSLEQGASPPRPVPRFRWCIHLVLLTAYPLALGATAAFARPTSDHPMLPTEPRLLLMAMGAELLLFGVVFGLAWAASRATAEELLLRWHGGFRTLARGFVYSIALRIGIAVVVVVLGIILAATGQGETAMAKLKPATENFVSARSLLDNPVYLLLNLTVLSFVVGGLREELWRAGMLAGLAALFPRPFQTAGGRFAALAFVAVVFGLGHLPQGLGGVLVTGLLGLGLGWVMLRCQSIWEPVLAHGFFDATTFACLWLFAWFKPDFLHG